MHSLHACIVHEPNQRDKKNWKKELSGHCVICARSTTDKECWMLIDNDTVMQVDCVEKEHAAHVVLMMLIQTPNCQPLLLEVENLEVESFEDWQHIPSGHFPDCTNPLPAGLLRMSTHVAEHVTSTNFEKMEVPLSEVLMQKETFPKLAALCPEKPIAKTTECRRGRSSSCISFKVHAICHGHGQRELFNKDSLMQSAPKCLCFLFATIIVVCYNNSSNQPIFVSVSGFAPNPDGVCVDWLATTTANCLSSVHGPNAGGKNCQCWDTAV